MDVVFLTDTFKNFVKSKKEIKDLLEIVVPPASEHDEGRSYTYPIINYVDGSPENGIVIIGNVLVEYDPRKVYRVRDETTGIRKFVIFAKRDPIIKNNKLIYDAYDKTLIEALRDCGDKKVLDVVNDLISELSAKYYDTLYKVKDLVVDQLASMYSRVLEKCRKDVEMFRDVQEARLIKEEVRIDERVQAHKSVMYRSMQRALRLQRDREKLINYLAQVLGESPEELRKLPDEELIKKYNMIVRKPLRFHVGEVGGEE